MTAATSTMTPEMLRRLRDDAGARPERYPGYHKTVIRYATWALGETADIPGIDCSIPAGREESYRQIALEESVRAWNWRTAEDAQSAVVVPRLGPEKLRLLQWLSDCSTMLTGSDEARWVLDEVIAAYRHAERVAHGLSEHQHQRTKP